jgi:hypothetical protein
MSDILKHYIQFKREHQRVMLELSIGKVIPRYVEPIDFTRFLAAFANEVGATLCVAVGGKDGKSYRLSRRLVEVALSHCDDDIGGAELLSRLLVIFVTMHGGKVKLGELDKRAVRRSQTWLGRLVEPDHLLTDIVDALRSEGWIDPDSYAALIEGELPISDGRRKRRLKRGHAKKGSRRYRERLKKQAARVAHRQELDKRRAAGEYIAGFQPKWLREYLANDEVTKYLDPDGND